jgi:serine/threonine-protein kinase RsbW
MAPEKTFEIHLPSTMGAEKVAMEFAATVARSMSFPDDRVEDLKTAVAEACMNAIEHGNKLDASIKVGVSLAVGQGSLQVAVQDKGGGIGKIRTPNLDEQIAEQTEPGGWGVFLMESLMDEVSFESTPQGTLVKMIIYLEK